MVINFSKQEAIELQNIMESVEPGSVETFKESIKDNKLVQIRINPILGTLEITVNNDYSVEFLQAYARFVGVLVSQAKALIATIELFTAESQIIVEKYM